MARLSSGEIPWARVGSALEDLLKYERRLGHYEHAAYDLLSVLVHGSANSPWRTFLLAAESFQAVVAQITAISTRDATTPAAALEPIRALVEALHTDQPESHAGFLDTYLPRRPCFPTAAREQLDRLALQANTALPGRAAVFAAAASCAAPDQERDELTIRVFEAWYERLARGELNEQQARDLPRQIAETRARLRTHFGETTPEPPAPASREITGDPATFDRTFDRVLTHANMAELTDLVLAADRHSVPIPVEQLEPFLDNLGVDGARRRLEQIGAWLAERNQQNHDGVKLTPVLTEYLAGPDDFGDLRDELERRRAETRAGRFRLQDELQRDLEYMRYATECSWLDDPPEDGPAQYARFKELPQLPPPRPFEDELELNGQHLAESKRTACEAAAFLCFLRAFRARTSRPIAVVGNDRYGRQWIVEPLEDYLRDGFIVGYFRNPSHKSMRLKVRHELFQSIRMGFTRDFILQLSEVTPHVVIADTCSPRGGPGILRLSRGARDYLNWFMAFNHVRADGDGSRYEDDSSLTTDHLRELGKWHEFDRVRRQLQDWVKPGPTYKVAHWGPVRKDTVYLGDFAAPCRSPDLDDESPQLILANPAVYAEDEACLPESVQGTNPYHFDGPERYARDEVVFGFGAHGFETRLQGTTTDAFVAAVQRCMRAEIDRLLRDPAQPVLRGENVWSEA